MNEVQGLGFIYYSLFICIFFTNTCKYKCICIYLLAIISHYSFMHAYIHSDGLGYHDDGEENMYDSDNSQTRNKNKQRQASAALTAKALKKARRNEALKKSENPATETNSLWNYVKPGASSSHRSSSAIRSSRPVGNLDSLLDELDSSSLSAVSSAKRSRGRRSMGSVSAVSRGARARRVYATSTSRRSQVRKRGYEEVDKRAEEWDQPSSIPDVDFVSSNQDSYDNDDDDDHDHVDFDAGHDVDHQVEDEVMTSVNDDDDDYDDSHDNAIMKEKQENGDKSSTEMNENTTDEHMEKKPKKKLVLKSNRANRMSAAAKAAMEKRIAAKYPTTTTAITAPVADAKTKGFATTAPSAVDTSSSSFQPLAIATDTKESVIDATLDAITQMQDDRKFIDIYWLDAHEKNGTVYMYGKTAVNNDFVSCCVVVKNNFHNLFVLPRKKEDGEEYSLMEVHNEMKSVLQPSCIPKVQGASWGGKVVKRKYAFGDSTVPREEREYLKVVYDAKYPKPSEDVCKNGGTTFSHIFGSGASTLENFILKRKLMGPCWVRVYDVAPMKVPVSWCKVEVEVDTPKNIVRCNYIPSADNSRPSPPITGVSLKIKTVVNPKTNKSEIIAVSAICHKKIMVDGATDEGFQNMTQLSLIRPLGLGVSSAGNALPQFPRDIDDEIKKFMPQLQRLPNERALLNRLMAQIGLWDPDVITGHNAWGYDIEVILNRCAENKVATWSKIGRRRRMAVPKANQFSRGNKDWVIADAMAGRLLCDTYVSSKELLKETTYSLSSLALSQLKTNRIEIEPVDIPQWFNESKTIVQLAMHTLHDAQLVQKLMFKLQVLPLTKQLTNIAGNLWARTMKGNRAERNEYLLLHEFHGMKYIVPEKEKGAKGNASSKAKYSGGLVLEPKKGLYDSFILLLDFNSLYPSIIQEYNLCFTTMDWSSYVQKGGGNKLSAGNDDDEDEEVEVVATDNLPPLPEESNDRGVLPRVIKTLVDRRRTVKGMLKNERDADKRQEVSRI